MKNSFFDGIIQWEFDLQETKGKLPVFYYDNTSLNIIYTASTEKVKNLLPHPDMKPIELYPGRCLIAFTAFEYRKTDIDPYNEFSIAFLITFKKTQIPCITSTWQMARRCFTAYVWQLPVTTEIARFGGVEMYGYPKFLADIDFRTEQEWITCSLSENGRNILSVRGKKLTTKKGKITRYITYSVKDGVPLKANVYMNPVKLAQSVIGKNASLEIGTKHPICKALSNLDLSTSDQRLL